jgi:energy-coupling factor transport system permease protein
MISSPVLLGQYRPSDSYLHSLDARAKALAVLAVMVLALLSNAIVFYVVLIGALVAGLLMSGVSGSILLRSSTPSLLLVVLTAVFHLIFSGRESDIQFAIWGWKIRSAAVSAAAFYSLRVVLFVAAAFLITFTSSPSELAEALTRAVRPLRRLRVPVNDLGLIIFIAIRFLPILYDEFMTIRNAQVMRGVDFGGSFLVRIRKTSYLLIPVFVAAVGRADDLALAIEARGYDSYAERTIYSQARFGAREIVFVLIAVGLMVTLFLATRHHD